MNVLSNRVCDMFQSFSWQLSSISDRLDHRIDDFRLCKNCSAFGRQNLVCCSFEFGASADSLQPKMAFLFESPGHLALFPCMPSPWMISTSLLRINRKSLLRSGWSDKDYPIITWLWLLSHFLMCFSSSQMNSRHSRNFHSFCITKWDRITSNRIWFSIITSEVQR